jgi:hypothetical protein
MRHQRLVRTSNWIPSTKPEADGRSREGSRRTGGRRNPTGWRSAVWGEAHYLRRTCCRSMTVGWHVLPVANVGTDACRQTHTCTRSRRIFKHRSMNFLAPRLRTSIRHVAFEQHQERCKRCTAAATCDMIDPLTAFTKPPDNLKTRRITTGLVLEA